MQKNDNEQGFSSVRIAWARWIYGNSCINPYKIKVFLKQVFTHF